MEAGTSIATAFWGGRCGIALVLPVGKRAADQALRQARSRVHRAGRCELRHVGYGTLLAYIWHQRRTPKHSAGLSTKPATNGSPRTAPPADRGGDPVPALPPPSRVIQAVAHGAEERTG